MYALTGKWFINPEKVEEAIAALKKLALDVQNQEPGTLLYQIFIPNMGESSLPPAVSTEVTFIEIYTNIQAFDDHINGEIFKCFVAVKGDLFVKDFNGNIYMTGEKLSTVGGFIRPELTS
jgi:quinol monooxygenase YgiN